MGFGNTFGFTVEFAFFGLIGKIQIGKSMVGNNPEMPANSSSSSTATPDTIYVRQDSNGNNWTGKTNNGKPIPLENGDRLVKSNPPRP